MPDRDKGHDLSVSPHDTTGETERQLTRRLLELEKEVCVWIALHWAAWASDLISRMSALFM